MEDHLIEFPEQLGLWKSPASHTAILSTDSQTCVVLGHANGLPSPCDDNGLKLKVGDGDLTRSRSRSLRADEVIYLYRGEGEGEGETEAMLATGWEGFEDMVSCQEGRR